MKVCRTFLSSQSADWMGEPFPMPSSPAVGDTPQHQGGLRSLPMAPLFLVPPPPPQKNPKVSPLTEPNGHGGHGHPWLGVPPCCWVPPWLRVPSCCRVSPRLWVPPRIVGGLGVPPRGWGVEGVLVIVVRGRVGLRHAGSLRLPRAPGGGRRWGAVSAGPPSWAGRVPSEQSRSCWDTGDSGATKPPPPTLIAASN